jgi:hypothetical protein
MMHCQKNIKKKLFLSNGELAWAISEQQIELQKRKPESITLFHSIILTSAFLLIHLAQDSAVVGSCEHGNAPSGPIKCWNFLTPVLLQQPLQTNPVPSLLAAHSDDVLSSSL